MKKIAIALALSLVMVAIVATPVMAAGPNGAVKAPIYDSRGWNAETGASDTSGQTYGFVILNTNGNGKVIVNIVLQGVTPNATFDIWVNQNPGACPLPGPSFVGALTTDADGYGNANIKIDRVVGAVDFWISATPFTNCLRSTAAILN